LARGKRREGVEARQKGGKGIGQGALARRIYRPVTRKQRTFYVSDALYDRMRAAVVHLAGSPEFLTMTAFLERAALRELERLERKHHGGHAFPTLPEGMRPRPGARPGGRPAGGE
jgi:hypothetical protein